MTKMAPSSDQDYYYSLLSSEKLEPLPFRKLQKGPRSFALTGAQVAPLLPLPPLPPLPSLPELSSACVESDSSKINNSPYPVVSFAPQLRKKLSSSNSRRDVDIAGSCTARNVKLSVRFKNNVEQDPKQFSNGVVNKFSVEKFHQISKKIRSRKSSERIVRKRKSNQEICNRSLGRQRTSIKYAFKERSTRPESPGTPKIHNMQNRRGAEEEARRSNSLGNYTSYRNDGSYGDFEAGTSYDVCASGANNMVTGSSSYYDNQNQFEMTNRRHSCPDTRVGNRSIDVTGSVFPSLLDNSEFFAPTAATENVFGSGTWPNYRSGANALTQLKSCFSDARNKTLGIQKKSVSFQMENPFVTFEFADPVANLTLEDLAGLWYSREEYDRFKFDAAEDAGVKIVQYTSGNDCGRDQTTQKDEGGLDQQSTEEANNNESQNIEQRDKQQCGQDMQQIDGVDDSQNERPVQQGQQLQDVGLAGNNGEGCGMGGAGQSEQLEGYQGSQKLRSGHQCKFVMVGDFDDSVSEDELTANSLCAIVKSPKVDTVSEEVSPGKDNDNCQATTHLGGMYKEYHDDMIGQNSVGAKEVCRRGLGYHFSRIRKKQRVLVRSAVLSWQKKVRDGAVGDYGGSGHKETLSSQNQPIPQADKQQQIQSPIDFGCEQQPEIGVEMNHLEEKVIESKDSPPDSSLSDDEKDHEKSANESPKLPPSLELPRSSASSRGESGSAAGQIKEEELEPLLYTKDEVQLRQQVRHDQSEDVTVSLPTRQHFPPLDKRTQLIIALISSKCSRKSRENAEWRGQMDYRVAYPERHQASFPSFDPESEHQQQYNIEKQWVPAPSASDRSLGNSDFSSRKKKRGRDECPVAKSDDEVDSSPRKSNR